MKKSITYNYSSSEIIERGHTIAQLTKEDLKKFEKFGVSQKDIDQLEKKLAEFKKFPEDGIFAEKVREKTHLKYDAEDKLITQIRNFFLQFSIIVPTKKETKKYFPSQKLTGLKSFELIEIGEKVVAVYKKFKEKLQKHEIDDQYILDLKAQISATKKTLKILENVRQERIRNTTKRRDLGSNLYEKIAKLSHYGKTYWKERDINRYKNYLLYVKNSDKTEETNDMESKELNND
ncbi:MAG: hypothetical protein MJZ61_03420 [Bacteroidales bacterium]|nr:hypothetical protein [Bacteroidales bacterium]